MLPNQTSSEALVKYYKATVITSLMLFNDFPDFLAAFHFSLVNALPAHAHQLKNIVLSAKPVALKQLDPFTEDLKIDLIPEMTMEALTLDRNFEAILKIGNLKENLDLFVSKREQRILTDDVCKKLDKIQASESQSQVKASTSVAGALALYIE